MMAMGQHVMTYATKITLNDRFTVLHKNNPPSACDDDDDDVGVTWRGSGRGTRRGSSRGPGRGNSRGATRGSSKTAGRGTGNRGGGRGRIYHGGEDISGESPQIENRRQQTQLIRRNKRLAQQMEHRPNVKAAFINENPNKMIRNPQRMQNITVDTRKKIPVRQRLDVQSRLSLPNGIQNTRIRSGLRGARGASFQGRGRGRSDVQGFKDYNTQSYNTYDRGDYNQSRGWRGGQRRWTGQREDSNNTSYSYTHRGGRSYGRSFRGGRRGQGRPGFGRSYTNYHNDSYMDVDN